MNPCVHIGVFESLCILSSSKCAIRSKSGKYIIDQSVKYYSYELPDNVRDVKSDGFVKYDSGS